jgi:uncharacterized protein DUF1360
MNEMGLTFRFILAALAVWRVTHLLASEDGPGDLVFRLRAKLGSGFFGRLMDCFYCLSLWIAAPFALLVTRQVMSYLLVWLALSGAACLLERVTSEPSVHNSHTEGDNAHALLRPEENRPEDQHFA